MNKDKRSRTIPEHISNAVKEKHFFQCAWCCVPFFDRHHIEEFHLGGKHTVENLILLCPNCHRQVHNSEIAEKELIKRSSTHLKNDRTEGGIPFEMAEMEIILGNATFRQVPVPLAYKEESLIEIKKLNEQLFVSAKFYNKQGELIFWMSSNRYWAPTQFFVQRIQKELIIINQEDSGNWLRIWEKDGVINLQGRNYINGVLLDFSPTYIRVGNPIMSTFSATCCRVGIRIR